MESDAHEDWDVDLISEQQLRVRRPDLVSVIESSAAGEKDKMKTLEQQLQEANSQLAAAKDAQKAAETKLQESEKVSKKAAAQGELTKLLSESKLPEPAQKRIRENFAEALSVDGMKEKIEFEREYIKSFAGSTQVRNLGKKDNGTELSESSDKTDPRTSFKESLMAAGFSEKDAEIAAAGRQPSKIIQSSEVASR